MGDSNTPELTLRVTADTKPAEQKVESFGEKFLSLGKTIAAGYAGYLSAESIIHFLEKSTEAAKASEAAVRLLNASMIAAGKYTKEASEDFQSYALQLEKTTGIQDTVIIKNAAMLEGIGHLTEDGLKQASKAALDLAAGLQIDVASAFDIMAKATAGNATMLTKYGLELNKRKTEAEKLGQVIDFVNGRFKDFAATQATSFEGVGNKFTNGFDKIETSIGNLITRSPILKAAISAVSDEFYKIARSIEEFSKRGDFVGRLVDGMLSLAVITSYVSSLFEYFGRLSLSILTALPTLIITGFAKIAEAADATFGTNLSGHIRTLADDAQDLWKSLAGPLVDPESLLTVKLAKTFDDLKNTIDETSKKFSSDLPLNIAQGTAESKSTWDQFVKGFNDGAIQIAGNAKTLGTQVSGTLISGMTSAVSAFGAALVTGKNGFEEFGKGILKTLGQLCMQIGQFLVLTGIGFSGLGFLGFTKGPAAIAAGLGLIVLGGVLSAIGGGSSEAQGGTANNVATNTPNTSADALTSPTSQAERAKANTSVVINVQGHILDRRETGVELVNIMNESFDTNGTIVRAIPGVV